MKRKLSSKLGESLFYLLPPPETDFPNRGYFYQQKITTQRKYASIARKLLNIVAKEQVIKEEKR
jgi:hypothetical protein